MSTLTSIVWRCRVAELIVIGISSLPAAAAAAAWLLVAPHCISSTSRKDPSPSIVLHCYHIRQSFRCVDIQVCHCSGAPLFQCVFIQVCHSFGYVIVQVLHRSVVLWCRCVVIQVCHHYSGVSSSFGCLGVSFRCVVVQVLHRSGVLWYGCVVILVCHRHSGVLLFRCVFIQVCHSGLLSFRCVIIQVCCGIGVSSSIRCVIMYMCLYSGVMSFGSFSRQPNVSPV